MIKWGNFEIKSFKITPKSIAAALIVGGYVLCVGTIFFVEIPGDQRDLAGQALTGLAALAGAIVNALFKGNTNDG